MPTMEDFFGAIMGFGVLYVTLGLLDNAATYIGQNTTLSEKIDNLFAGWGA